jgi:hypothetical protein
MPVVHDDQDAFIQQDVWGGMNVEIIQIREPRDLGPIFRGLPDDMCQCSHWGYVFKGQLRYQFADHEEIYNAGDLYYIPPGHLPSNDAGTEYVELTSADEIAETMKIVSRNMADLGGH